MPVECILVSAGARERNGLGLIVSGFVIIARERER